MKPKLQKTFTPKPATSIASGSSSTPPTARPWGGSPPTIAIILRGKHKPTFAPHVDGGDYVIVVNAEKVAVTGNKETDKMYYRHSGYPGRSPRAEPRRDAGAAIPSAIIETAVRGMLPKNRLGRQMFSKLKVYAGPEHPHAAQNPQCLDRSER